MTADWYWGTSSLDDRVPPIYPYPHTEITGLPPRVVETTGFGDTKSITPGYRTLSATESEDLLPYWAVATTIERSAWGRWHWRIEEVDAEGRRATIAKGVAKTLWVAELILMWKLSKTSAIGK